MIFGLWKIKIQSVLAQQKCAMKGEVAISTNLTLAEKIEMIDKANSVTFILCFRDIINGYREGSDNNIYVGKVRDIINDKVFDL